MVGDTHEKCKINLF